MNCMQPQGSSMQSLGVGPARLLNSSRTVWVRVCLLCHTPFCTTALWVLLCVMEARVACVHCSRHIGVFHSAREMGVLHMVQRLVPSCKPGQSGSSAVAQSRIFTSGLVLRLQTRHQLPFVQFTKCAHFHYEETLHLRIHSFQTLHAEDCQQVKTRSH